MRRFDLSDVLILLGGAGLIVGLALLNLSWALIVAGVLLALVGVALGLRR